MAEQTYTGYVVDVLDVQGTDPCTKTKQQHRNHYDVRALRLDSAAYEVARAWLREYATKKFVASRDHAFMSLRVLVWRPGGVAKDYHVRVSIGMNIRRPQAAS